MGLMERVFRLLMPRGRPWALAGDGDPLAVGLGVTLERPRTDARAILTEARPGTAVLMLPEWCEALGVRYDPTMAVADLQARLNAVLTAMADPTLNELQAQISRELPNIALSETSSDSECGTDECGVALCGALEGDFSSQFFDITGSIPDDSYISRLASLLQKYAPLHLQACTFNLNVLSVDESSEAGADTAMLAVAEGYGGVYVSPTFAVNPTIAGDAYPGGALACMPGKVLGGPTPSLAYQWRLGGGDIGGATTPFYQIPDGAALGNSYTCKVTATNAAGSANVESAAIVLAATLVYIKSVGIGSSGGASPALIVSSVDVVSFPAATLTYQWYKDGSVIGGATSNSYALAGQTGSFVCRVTANNGTNQAARDSNALITFVSLTNVVIVSSGGASPTLYVTEVDVSGFPTPTLTYQWYRNGGVIGGATASNYAIAGVAGSYVCRVTASNGAASPTRDSNALQTAGFTSGPTASFNQVFQYCTYTVVYTGSGGVSYQWYMNGAAVPGQTGYQYLYLGFQGPPVFCRVTLTNDVGSIYADSNTV
jgi:hypothetical protein